jgi:D-tyrosyl-tRNA(Tyr) deacylase
MRVVIQRVLNAQVVVDEKIVGKINKGFLIFVGVGENDTESDADKLISKIFKLRIFSDENDKINMNLESVNGEILVVSQFTLYADCKKSNRPSFSHAAKPETAEKIYNYFIDECRKRTENVQTGIFRADMKVSLCNDGPFTILLDTDK